jgi:hypothetical protein
MARGNRSSGPEKKVTCFSFAPMRDETIAPGAQLVLLVHNIADATAHGKDAKRGKPAGFGMSGGGLKEDCFESPDTAAENEFQSETGLKIRKIRSLGIEKHKVIVSDRKSGEMVRQPIFYENGQMPALQLRANETMLLNDIHLFLALPQWEGSRLQKIAHETKSRLGMTDKEVAHEGLLVKFSELSKEDVASLDIVELGEIDAIWLAPLEMILSEGAEVQAVFAEADAKHQARPNVKQGAWDFYPSHLLYMKEAHEAAIKLGLIV